MRVPKLITTSFDYILPSERKLPKEDQTIFKLKLLTIEQEAYLDNIDGVSKTEYKVNAGTKMIDALNMGIEDVINFYVGDDEKPFEFQRDETKKLKTYPGKIRPWKSEHLGLIPKDDRSELYLAIKGVSELEEEEAKNS